jgi:hypothetical protein
LDISGPDARRGPRRSSDSEYEEFAKISVDPGELNLIRCEIHPDQSPPDTRKKLRYLDSSISTGLVRL